MVPPLLKLGAIWEIGIWASRYADAGLRMEMGEGNIDAMWCREYMSRMLMPTLARCVCDLGTVVAGLHEQDAHVTSDKLLMPPRNAHAMSGG
jgi:hypothetical protein